MSGKLFICPTPIGNLQDITLRVLEVLRQVDLIAAEDTRQTRKLLTHFQIKKELTSYHEHNERSKGPGLVEQLKSGRQIALVSDAGMPGLSDPGHRLVKACLEENIAFEVLPGPSAAITALVLSGLPTASFIYLGFLPRKQGERRKLLKEAASEPRTLVFYESPHRVESSLRNIYDILGNRKMVIARELTKKFEEVLRGTVQEILARVEKKPPKGELVLVVSGSEQTHLVPPAAKLREMVVVEMAAGLSKKEAIKKLSGQLRISKKIVYEAAKDLHEEVGKDRMS